MSVKITCDVFHRRKYHVWKGACMAMLERRLNSKEENKREEKEERRGVVKVGGAITWSRDNAHATGRRILRQQVKVPVSFLATPQQRSMQRSMTPMVIIQLSCNTINFSIEIMSWLNSMRKNKLKIPCAPYFSASRFNWRIGCSVAPVSYTHLTLPTILRV